MSTRLNPSKQNASLLAPPVQIPHRPLDSLVDDLEKAFRDAKKLCADIMWDISPSEEISAHKAILYARAPKEFLKKFISSPNPRRQSLTSYSTLSVTSYESRESTVTVSVPLDADLSPDVFRAALKFLYTSQIDANIGKSAIFELLYGGQEPSESSLKTDLQYMYTSGLYSDVRIVLAGLNGQPDTLIPAHRFMLIIRSEYFSALLTSGYGDSQVSTVTLPNDIFTPSSVAYILNFLYTGDVSASSSTMEVGAALEIFAGADFLGVKELYEDTLLTLVKICHDFRCTCVRCRKNLVAVLHIAQERQIKWLEECAYWPLVQAFGETWDMPVGKLPISMRNCLVLGVQNLAEENPIFVLRECDKLQTRYEVSNADWTINIKDMLDSVRKAIDKVFAKQPTSIVRSSDFIQLLDGIGFSHDLLELCLKRMVGTLNDQNAALLYQVLIGEGLLREQGVDTDVANLINDAKVGIIQYLRKNWVGVKSFGGFQHMETWALKEIADEIDVPVKEFLDILELQSGPKSRTGLKIAMPRSKKKEDDEVGPSSLRAAVLNRNAARVARRPEVSLSVPKKVSSTVTATPVGSSTKRNVSAITNTSTVTGFSTSTKSTRPSSISSLSSQKSVKTTTIGDTSKTNAKTITRQSGKPSESSSVKSHLGLNSVKKVASSPSLRSSNSITKASTGTQAKGSTSSTMGLQVGNFRVQNSKAISFTSSSSSLLIRKATSTSSLASQKTTSTVGTRTSLNVRTPASRPGSIHSVASTRTAISGSVRSVASTRTGVVPSSTTENVDVPLPNKTNSIATLASKRTTASVSGRLGTLSAKSMDTTSSRTMSLKSSGTSIRSVRSNSSTKTLKTSGVESRVKVNGSKPKVVKSLPVEKETSTINQQQKSEQALKSNDTECNLDSQKKDNNMDTDYSKGKSETEKEDNLTESHTPKLALDNVCSDDGGSVTESDMDEKSIYGNGIVTMSSSRTTLPCEDNDKAGDKMLGISNGSKEEIVNSNENLLQGPDETFPNLYVSAQTWMCFFWYKKGNEIAIGKGKIRYIGMVSWSNIPHVGIELEYGDEHSDSHGTIDGRTYFEPTYITDGSKNYARFVPGNQVIMEKKQSQIPALEMKEAREARRKRLEEKLSIYPLMTWRPFVSTL